MNIRPTFDSIYINFAKDLSKRSTCKRLSVGAIITSEDYRYVYGLGYNGTASGLSNDSCTAEEGKCGCLHAEENAVINCREDRNTPKILFCTHMPCVMCTKRIINLGGIKRVLYLNEYRSIASIDILEYSGITLEKFNE